MAQVSIWARLLENFRYQLETAFWYQLYFNYSVNCPLHFLVISILMVKNEVFRVMVAMANFLWHNIK